MQRHRKKIEHAAAAEAALSLTVTAALVAAAHERRSPHNRLIGAVQKAADKELFHEANIPLP
jgi:hypothetical protein